MRSRGTQRPAPRRSAPRLFDPADLDLRPTGSARLVALSSRRQHYRDTDREARRREDEETVTRLRRLGGDLARHFGLSWRALIAERDGVNEHYGICYEDGEIRIRLRHARTGKLLKESSLVDTVCHELAHLRHLDHSDRFKKFYLQILELARERGYYRPGPQGDSRPRQLSLFGGGCGTR